MSSLSLALKALRELGPRQLGFYALYRFGMRSGYYRRLTRGWAVAADANPSAFDFHPVLNLPGRDALADVLGKQGVALLMTEAQEVVAGQVRLFGSQPVQLQLAPPDPLYHWTEYELGRQGNGDVKFFWEASRFGWAFTLGRAYYLSGDERFPQAFWRFTEEFLDANPPYLGLHWSSGQEVALRLMAFAFAGQVFIGSLHTTSARLQHLAQAIAQHAARIPPTLAYARAQNNNHLLSEAAGLFTAGVVLKGHPSAEGWRSLGWRLLNEGLRTQIARDGAYIQHSTNYHRLMLQIAMWVNHLSLNQGRTLEEDTRICLAAATHWLLALLDPESGGVPNLGPNDGAYILPLTVRPFQDYRPVLQAAGSAFLGEKPFLPGPWDEMRLWLDGREDKKQIQLSLEEGSSLSNHLPCQNTPHVIRNAQPSSWAYLRVARFTNRPGHADQLHLDLWWRGLNLAQDAGTYLYNAPPPWDNALSGSQVHNTLIVNGRDQMTRAGRFLYLDWAQAWVVAHERAEDNTWERLVAQHDGYQGLGAIHQRSVTALMHEGWLIEDKMLPARRAYASRKRSFAISLHWLLPDWRYDVKSTEDQYNVGIHSPYGAVRLELSLQREADFGELPRLNIVRGGELVFGEGPASPLWGWSSPTYGVKVPAISVIFSLKSLLPVSLKSQWLLPIKKDKSHDAGRSPA